MFFDDVRVPARNLVGEENRGWYVGTTTLDFERSRHRQQRRHAQERRQPADLGAASTATTRACTVARNPVVRNELVERYIEVNVQKMLSYRVIDMQNRGLSLTPRRR